MSAPAQVIIAVDPHKASWTAIAVDSRPQPLAAIRVEVNRDGYRQLRRFARRWPQAIWAVEGAAGLGAPLTSRLAAEAVDMVDLPATPARRVRMLPTGHDRTSNEADALVDRPHHPHRHPPEHRDNLLRTRTQDIQRHRLSRAGVRQLNYALHVIAITQTQRATPGSDYYQRKRAAGKTHEEALRCHRQRLADVVHRTMIRDTETSLLPTA